MNSDKLDAAREYYEKHTPKPDNGYWTAKEPCIAMMAGFAVEDAAAQNRWRDIEKDGLPEVSGEYLVTAIREGKRFTIEALWVGYWDLGTAVYDEIIAWMPMPQPYQKEKE